MSTQSYFVKGMHCAACELVVERKLSKAQGLSKVNAILKTNKVSFEIDDTQKQDELLDNLNGLLADTGYELCENSTTKKELNYRELSLSFVIATAIMGGFLLLQKLGIANILGSSGELSLPMVFLIGIVASVSTCMALVGGLVLSLSSNFAKGQDKVKPLIGFHASRIITFLILGGVIGWLGSVFTLSPTFYLIMSLLLFLVMVIMGINLLDVFPFFNKLQLRLPKSLSKVFIKEGDTQNRWTAIVFGAATFFLPCGFTQSMQFSAIASGSAGQGALIMLVFALGTLPMLALISFSSFKMAGSQFHDIFFKSAGFLVLFFAVFNLIGSLVAAGLINPLF
jgi:sulfite exporter TauE/SafE/copper chaperone CopZ